MLVHGAGPGKGEGHLPIDEIQWYQVHIKRSSGALNIICSPIPVLGRTNTLQQYTAPGGNT